MFQVWIARIGVPVNAYTPVSARSMTGAYRRSLQENVGTVNGTRVVVSELPEHHGDRRETFDELFESVRRVMALSPYSRVCHSKDGCSVEIRRV